MSEVKVACDHCWHGTNVVLTSNPPQAEEICCYCGTKRYLIMVASIEPGKHHGPFNPRPWPFGTGDRT